MNPVQNPCNLDFEALVYSGNGEFRMTELEKTLPGPSGAALQLIQLSEHCFPVWVLQGASAGEQLSFLF